MFSPLKILLGTRILNCFGSSLNCCFALWICEERTANDSISRQGTTRRSHYHRRVSHRTSTVKHPPQERIAGSSSLKTHYLANGTTRTSDGGAIHCTKLKFKSPCCTSAARAPREDLADRKLPGHMALHVGARTATRQGWAPFGDH